MDHKTNLMWMAALALLAGGCSAPHAVNQGEKPNIAVPDKRLPLARAQFVAQVQVDAASVYRQLIEYFDGKSSEKPAAGTLAAPRRAVRRLDARLSFKPGSADLLPTYGRNRIELARLCRELTSVTGGKEVILQTIDLTGYASPDGNTLRNEELATGRVLHLSNYLKKELRLPESAYVFRQATEDWTGLRQAIQEANKPYASRVEAVLDSISDPDVRRKTLRGLNSGKVWKDMENTLFAGLRRIQVEVVYLTTEPEEPLMAEASPADPDLVRLLASFGDEPERLTLNELLAVSVAFRPGTEQYREVYELAAYRFPDCEIAQLNAGAAALHAMDTLAARFFLERMSDNPKAWINLGVLALIENEPVQAAEWFMKAMPIRPRQARACLRLLDGWKDSL